MNKKIFLTEVTPEILNINSQGTLLERIGIEFIEVGDDYLVARMPVDERTFQPARILHGGASVVLAESLGSTSASLTLDMSKQYCVGLEINANHIKAMREGWVYGKSKALHIGKSTQVWEISITDENQRLVCISRITMAVLNRAWAIDDSSEPKDVKVKYLEKAIEANMAGKEINPVKV